MVGHGVKAFRLTPERLHDRVNVGRKLAHLADQPLERSRGSWTEDPDEPPWRAWRTTGEKRQACAHDPKACQQPTNPRQVPPAPQHAGALVRHGQPFRRRVDQHDTSYTPGTTRRVRTNDEAATSGPRVHSDLQPAMCGEHFGQFVNNSVEGSGHEGASLQASPARSYAQTRVNVAIWGCTTAQLREEAANAGFEQHNWTALPATECMQTVSAHVDQESRRSEPPSIAAASDRLIESSGPRQRDQNDEERHLLIVDPRQNQRNLEQASNTSGAAGNSMQNFVPSPPASCSYTSWPRWRSSSASASARASTPDWHGREE